LQQVPAARAGGLASVFAQRATPDKSRSKGGIGGGAGSYGAEVDAINAEFSAKLDSLRRRLRLSEIPAAMRQIKADRAEALRALKDRKQGERFAAREITRRQRAPPTARPS
jgi:hypothetical protein